MWAQAGQPHTGSCCVPPALQARAEAVVSSLQGCCNGLDDGNSTVVGEAVAECPPENVTALSTALAQATTTTDGAATVAEVGARPVDPTGECWACCSYVWVTTGLQAQPEPVSTTKDSFVSERRSRYMYAQMHVVERGESIWVME